MKYFAYGMNTNREQMASRCPQAVGLGHARLPGYRLVFNRHADIQEHSGVCDGVLWDITDECLSSLDLLEGYPYYYTRFQVLVEWQDQLVQAITYQMQPQHQVAALPSPGYYSMVSEGYAYHQVPKSQLQQAFSEAGQQTNLAIL